MQCFGVHIHCYVSYGKILTDSEIVHAEEPAVELHLGAAGASELIVALAAHDYRLNLVAGQLQLDMILRICAALDIHAAAQAPGVMLCGSVAANNRHFFNSRLPSPA